MKTRIIDTRKMYCPRFPQPEVLILIWEKGSTECVKAKGGDCPYVKEGNTCRYYSVGDETNE